MKKICHMTSAHGAEDVRIFIKECISLAKAGYEVYLVERGESYDKSGVHIVGVGDIPESRMKRMSEGSRIVYEKALSLDCDIYHFHDPELLPYGLKLKKHGKKVIFDSHEDVPAQIRDKKWIPQALRKTVASVYRSYETHVARQIDAVIPATPHIAENFAGRAKKNTVVNNFPKLDDIAFHDTPFAERDAVVCYAGGISEDRGEKIMLEAMEKIDGHLILAGDHEKQEISCANGRGKVSYVGRLNRAGVNELYGKAVVGLCILKPIENYFYSQPIKMYEYMAAGIPFVCCDFPVWRKVAEESRAGICVDGSSLPQIAEAVNKLLQNRELAEKMGRDGHEYVIRNCCWTNEEEKLLALYADL